MARTKALRVLAVALMAGVLGTAGIALMPQPARADSDNFSGEHNILINIFKKSKKRKHRKHLPPPAPHHKHHDRPAPRPHHGGPGPKPLPPKPRPHR